MKFKLVKSSNYDFESKIEFKTLVDVLNFVKENTRIIISYLDNEFTVEIYDDYRE